ncbi:hypothetical protein N9O69_05025 [Alphaproteobacteria bacterium]|nr:hypothetical protein [Alphaproteobacteria bacterium]
MYKRKFLLILLILFINGCMSSSNNFDNLNKISLSSSNKLKSYDDNKLKSYDDYVFQEHLKRIFKTEIDKPKRYSLITSIIFESSSALTSINLTPLTKTQATVTFEIYDLKTQKILKTGSIKSSPAIGSTSSSLFSNDINKKHIKERLNTSLALKLSKYLNLIIPKLK